MVLAQVNKWDVVLGMALKFYSSVKESIENKSKKTSRVDS